ncbi:MAG: putative methionine--tRNA ligase, cytoplasmic protein rar1 [Phylliscum demangeonii]|nr:MAG: putative methionine--tRNA ligase, cytoplasmic protein rar1 [Phylliscum demangeonii]
MADATSTTTTTTPILPDPGQQNILITSALPYVNNTPHLGNIVGSVLSADVFARFSRLRGQRTLYICGTDEYGTATETKALEEGISPQELCDKYHALHADIYRWFEIGFDYFGRTTTRQQTAIAQAIFRKLDARGHLAERRSVQPYCERHAAFLADRFVEGTCPRCGYADARGDQCDACGRLLDALDLVDPRCKLDGATPVPRPTSHIYLRLDQLQPAIEAWATAAAEAGAWSRNGRQITDAWLKEGLRERGITRDLTWGTPVPRPGYEHKVLYVWFDACIGYLSITANYTADWERWWRAPEHVRLYQFLGKDNVPFHTVIFPGTQLGTGERWTMLHHLSTTEYLNYEHGKFSKSRGVGVFGHNARDTGVPPAVWRYYLLATRPETADSQFEWGAFIAKNNSELLANLGNFVNRVIKFANAKYDSRVPDPGPDADADPAADFAPFIADVNRLLALYVSDLTAVHLRSGLERMMAVSSRGNAFLQENKLDNQLLATQPRRAAHVVQLALNAIYLLASLVHPYMPSTAAAMSEQLQAPLLAPLPDVWDPGALKAGHVLGRAKHLFARIDEKKEAEWRAMYGQKKEGAVEVVPKLTRKQMKLEKEKEKGKGKVPAAAGKGVAVATVVAAGQTKDDGDRPSPDGKGETTTTTTEEKKKAMKKEEKEKKMTKANPVLDDATQDDRAPSHASAVVEKGSSPLEEAVAQLKVAD